MNLLLAGSALLVLSYTAQGLTCYHCKGSFVFFESYTCGLWGEKFKTCEPGVQYCSLTMRQQSSYNFMYTGTAPRMLDQPWERGCTTARAVQGDPYSTDPEYKEVPGGAGGMRCKKSGRKKNGEEEYNCLCTTDLCNDRISGSSGLSPPSTLGLLLLITILLVPWAR